MPADRHIPVSPRKDEIYAKPSGVNPPEDPPCEITRLPPFSDFYRYGSPSPPATDMMHTSPSRAATRLPITPKPSAGSTRFPASPYSPMSCSTSGRSAMLDSDSPRPSLPSFSSLFGASWSPGIPIHHTNDTSLGLPNADGPTKPRGDEVREALPQMLEPAAGGLRESITCGWPDCTGAKAAIHKKFWLDHLNQHFSSSTKTEEGKAMCRWSGCGKYIGRRYWTIHIRRHDDRFSTTCPVCGHVCFVTSLWTHMTQRHPTTPNNGAT